MENNAKLIMNKINDFIENEVEKIITGQSYEEELEHSFENDKFKNINTSKKISSVYSSKEIQDKVNICMQRATIFNEVNQKTLVRK